MSPCLVPGLELRWGGEGKKRKKLVWKLAVLKAFGVKGGMRCYSRLAAPFTDILVTENVGIRADWLPWETQIPLCNERLRRWDLKGTSCCLVYSNCAFVTEWFGLSRLYCNPMVFDPLTIGGLLQLNRPVIICTIYRMDLRLRICAKCASFFPFWGIKN